MICNFLSLFSTKNVHPEPTTDKALFINSSLKFSKLPNSLLISSFKIPFGSLFLLELNISKYKSWFKTPPAL